MANGVSSITGKTTKYQGLPLGARAVQIADGTATNYFLTTFGRASRETCMANEVKLDPTLSQALHFLNGDTINDSIKQGKVVASMIAEKKSDKDIVDELFLRCFGREPVKAEVEAITAKLSETPDARQMILEDVFWALLNSKEFYFNH